MFGFGVTMDLGGNHPFDLDNYTSLSLLFCFEFFVLIPNFCMD